MPCLWCYGTGSIALKSYGIRKCPNCKGTGEGTDGGDRGPIISGKHKLHMLGNKHGCKKVSV